MEHVCFQMALWLGSLPGSVLGSSWLHYVARNWALFSIALTVAVILVTGWLILRKYVLIMLNIIRDTPPPLAMGPCDFERIEGERVTFRAFDNLNLCGMFVWGRGVGDGSAERPADGAERADIVGPALPEPRSRSRGVVIFAHEFSSDKYSCARYCQALLEAGYDIFSFDFRGHGESSADPAYQPRQWPTEREVDDMLGAIAFVEDWLEQQGRPVEIALFGISRGAGAAILAAQHNPAIKAIITDGAFSSDTTLEYLMKRWAYIFAKVRFVYENHPPQFWRFLRWLLFRECKHKLGCVFPSVRKALKRMRPDLPILFIHGGRDSYIPVEQSQLLYKCARGPKSLWVVPGAKHNQSVVVCGDYYGKRCASFLREHYRPPRPRAEALGAAPAADGASPAAESAPRGGASAGVDRGAELHAPVGGESAGDARPPRRVNRSPAGQ